MTTVMYLGLALLASLSPLLTFAWLWQVKEWRFDRLREHLRNEGCFRQLFGLIRPTTVFVLSIAGVSYAAFRPVWHTVALALLGILTLVQLGLRKQRFPVWTQKAVTLVLSTLVVDAIIANSWFSREPALLAVLPLFQAFTLALSWFLFWPPDRFLKRRKMRRAQKLREQFPDLTVIGITGSVGKTTVKELLSCILTGRNVQATPAYVNSEMGVSSWLLKELSRQGNHSPEVLIVEMGAYRQGEIALLCRIAKPTMGIVTFIGKQHMGLFGSQEALVNAKAELVEALPPDGIAFLNADNAACAALAKRTSCTVQTVGTGGHTDIEAFDIEETPTGIAFRTGDTRFGIPLHGTHNVTNVLLAIAAARALGMRDRDIAQAVSKYTPPDHTFSVRTEKGVTILDDTHNASPHSFKAAIAWARTQPAKQKVLLTSGLIELGTEQDHIHSELGETAQGVFDRVIFMNPRSGQFFGKGYKKPIEVCTPFTEKMGEDTLLICIGRIPPATIQRLLP